MSVIGYAWLLANETFRLLLVWWPVTAVLVIAAVVVIRLKGLQTDQQLRSLPTVLLLFPVLIVLWAAMVHVEEGVGIGVWRLAVVILLLMLHLAATAAVVYVSRSFRPQTLSLGILIGWVTGMCGYVAVRAVTGRFAMSG